MEINSYEEQFLIWQSSHLVLEKDKMTRIRGKQPIKGLFILPAVVRFVVSFPFFDPNQVEVIGSD